MKNYITFFLAVSLFFSCKNHENQESDNTEQSSELEYFGAPITQEEAINASEFFNHFSEGDSVHMKLTGEINKVCKKKGCWMTIDLGNDQDLLVQFKDYGFFVPLNADGRTATIDGWAFKEIRPVEELKHYAFDEGKSEEEINAITEPEVSYTFIADGVILE